MNYIRKEKLAYLSDAQQREEEGKKLEIWRHE